MREVVTKQKISNIAGSGVGQTDWTLPTGTVEVEVEFFTSVEATASNAIAFRDASGELLVIGQAEAPGRYRFKHKPPAGATILRVDTDNGSGGAADFYETIRFIIET